MVNAETWAPKLKKMGLSAYEARVYLTLLEEGEATPSKLVRRSGVPQPRVYVALGVLVERGFAEMTLGGTKVYRAVPPTVVFQRHQRRQEEAMRASMVELADEMKSLESEIPQSPNEDPTSYGIRLVRGADHIANILHGFYDQANEEICIMLRYPPVTNVGRERVAAMLERGVKVRMIVDRAYFEDDNLSSSYFNYSKQTGNVRWRDEVPLRMVVIDHRTYVLPLEEADSTPTLLIVPNAVVSAGMRAVFEELWASSHEPSELPAPSTRKQS